jgi:hypothetical protein
VIVGRAFDQHKFDILRAEPFCCLESIFPMLTEFAGFQIACISMINCCNDDVLIGIASPCDAEARMNLRLPTSTSPS